MMKRIGFVGYVCANAGSTAIDAAIDVHKEIQWVRLMACSVHSVNCEDGILPVHGLRAKICDQHLTHQHRKITMKFFCVRALLCVPAILTSTGMAMAQQYPTKPIRLNEPDVSYHGVVYTEAGPAAYIGRARGAVAQHGWRAVTIQRISDFAGN
jgi:hypothetical protein